MLKLYQIQVSICFCICISDRHNLEQRKQVYKQCKMLNRSQTVWFSCLSEELLSSLLSKGILSAHLKAAHGYKKGRESTIRFPAELKDYRLISSSQYSMVPSHLILSRGPATHCLWFCGRRINLFSCTFTQTLSTQTIHTKNSQG